MLKTLDNPPPLLAVKGEGAVFRMPAVAIVGARNASLAGIKMARMLAADLGREGYAIRFGPGARRARPAATPCSRMESRW